jgi:lysyl-tRNA synthetase class I
MPEDIKEIMVPCPCCGKIHKVEVKKIRENKYVKVDCGATMGSLGMLRRLEEAEAKAKDQKSRLYKLD